MKRRKRSFYHSSCFWSPQTLQAQGLQVPQEASQKQMPLMPHPGRPGWFSFTSIFSLTNDLRLGIISLYANKSEANLPSNITAQNLLFLTDCLGFPQNMLNVKSTKKQPNIVTIYLLTIWWTEKFWISKSSGKQSWKEENRTMKQNTKEEEIKWERGGRKGRAVRTQ